MADKHTAESERHTIVKSKVGQVVSDKMDKTILVRVNTIAIHPLYKKRVRKSKKFMAHDEQNVARFGDLVRIVEARPRSKMKSWQLDEVVRAAGLIASVADEESEIIEATASAPAVGESATNGFEATAVDTGEAEADDEGSE